MNKNSDQKNSGRLVALAELLFLILLVGFVGLRLLYFGPRLEVAFNYKDDVVYLDPAAEDEIESEIRGIFSSTSSRLRPFIPRDKIDSLIADNPYVSSVDTRLDDIGSDPGVIINMEEVYAELAIGSSDVSYLVASGFLTDPQTRGLDQTLVTLSDKSGLAIIYDQQYLSSSQTSFIQDISSYTSRQGYKIAQIVITDNPRELLVEYVDSQLPPMLMLMSGSAVEQGTAYKEALEFLKADIELSIDGLQELEYIDVRLINRVIYK